MKRKELINDGEEIKARRSAMVSRKRKADPASFLAYKFYNTVRKINGVPPSLWSRKTVKRIYDACNGKSVIGDEDDYMNLCVQLYYADVYEEWNMVLLSTREAMSMRKMKNIDARNAMFPEAVRNKMNLLHSKREKKILN